MSKESLYNLNWRIYNAVLQDWKAAFPASAEQFMKKGTNSSTLSQ